MHGAPPARRRSTGLTLAKLWVYLFSIGLLAVGVRALSSASEPSDEGGPPPIELLKCAAALKAEGQIENARRHYQQAIQWDPARRPGPEVTTASPGTR